jgi:hypothetical protein
MRVTWTAFAAPEVGASAVPHTVHLVALAFNRVPQVGQIFVDVVVVSELIGTFFGLYQKIAVSFQRSAFSQRGFDAQ